MKIENGLVKIIPLLGTIIYCFVTKISSVHTS
ncbi:hypothetical protein VP424E501_P0125 [Vibrio phage 424E50-1]|nr:hypothetical protein VP424E501_P0125 [Vibrio phage 424E50-1]